MTIGTGGARWIRRQQRELGAESEIRLGCDQLVSSREGFGYALVDAAKFDDKISTLGESELAQFFKQDGISKPCGRAIAGWAKHAQTSNIVLCACHQRPRRHRAAEKRDELAPSHSITSSASA